MVEDFNFIVHAMELELYSREFATEGQQKKVHKLSANLLYAIALGSNAINSAFVGQRMFASF